MPQSPIDAAYRRRLRQAVFPDVEGSAPDQGWPAAVAGLVLEAGPRLLVLATNDGHEVRVAVSEKTSVWYAGAAATSALQPGRRAIVRPAAPRPSAGGLASTGSSAGDPADDGPVAGEVTAAGSATGAMTADRIWLDIVRANGVIVDRGRATVEIDEGPHRGRTHVVIPANVLSHILVRHPHFEPGYLFDVIGIRAADGHGVVAVRPGAPQPDYPADQVPKRRPVWPVPHEFAGTATWFSAPGRQVAYPAIDPSGGGCQAPPNGCATLPYLSLGSELVIRNECTGRTATMPVTQCGCTAARFCDRCVTCGTSPRGRIVELSPASFVDLGGDLDEGCFNVTVRVG
ncbi:MAG TPA: hypothetical protein VF069_02455 [Streptosporangiaceae bacterium]